MNDWELFEAMNEAEKRFEALRAEFRARGLHNKPLYEYSRAAQPCVQLTGLCPDCKNPLAWEVVSSICPNHQYRPATNA